MGISGIAANYYQTVYANNKATKAETGKTFAEIASQKVAEAEKETVQENTSAVLDVIGANAPDEVRQAWTEAQKESGVDGHITKCGLWISNDGKHAHITQVMIQTAIKWAKGEFVDEQADLLGNSVQSAINAVEKWIYDIDHPLAGQPAKSTEEQRYVNMERTFYVAFLEKLKNLSGREQQETATGKSEGVNLAEIIGTTGSRYYKATSITREAVSAAYEKNFVEA
ncbi:MAG: hypothetical protein HDR19_09475 [Lachnospiraceae bacterium]|nr:hypothetical protein [Lachnospiraceae bacterium]